MGATFSGRANDPQGRVLLGNQLANDAPCVGKAKQHTRGSCKLRATGGRFAASRTANRRRLRRLVYLSPMQLA